MCHETPVNPRVISLGSKVPTLEFNVKLDGVATAPPNPTIVP